MDKVFQGNVVANKMSKTIVVEVYSQYKHPVYKKISRKTKRYKVHSENSAIKPGDEVLFKETRPISKDKKYILVKKLEAQK